MFIVTAPFCTFTTASHAAAVNIIASFAKAGVHATYRTVAA